MTNRKDPSRRRKLSEIKQEVLRRIEEDPFWDATPAQADRIKRRMDRFHQAWQPIGKELMKAGYPSPRLKEMPSGAVEDLVVQEILVAGLLATDYPALNMGLSKRLREAKRSMVIQRGMLSNIHRMNSCADWELRERENCSSISGQNLFSQKLFPDLGPEVLDLVRECPPGEAVHWLLKALGKSRMDLLERAELERFLSGEIEGLTGALFYSLKNGRADVLDVIRRLADDSRPIVSKEASKVLAKLG